MTLRTRLIKLELKNRLLGPALVLVRDGETKQQALQRCYPGEKPGVAIYLSRLDVLV